MSAFSALLNREFAPFGSLSESQVSRLEAHYALLLKWNQKINLTRITSLDEAVQLHYCESLYVSKYIPTLLPAGPLRIADIGSGAGFPGIPLAVIRPDSSFDLIESDQRKAVFLSEAVRDLSNVRVIAKRAADIQPDVPYDFAVARAVAVEDVLSSSLSTKYLILGAEGEKLPWGINRRIRFVDVPRET